MAKATSPVRVPVGRTVQVGVQLAGDISADTFSSQIRAEKDPTSTLLADWSVSFKTDGTDGLLVLTLDDSDTVGITRASGWMDIKRVGLDNEPVNVFAQPLKVVFEQVVTA